MQAMQPETRIGPHERFSAVQRSDWARARPAVPAAAGSAHYEMPAAEPQKPGPFAIRGCAGWWVRDGKGKLRQKPQPRFSLPARNAKLTHAAHGLFQTRNPSRPSSCEVHAPATPATSAKRAALTKAVEPTVAAPATPPGVKAASSVVVEQTAHGSAACIVPQGPSIA
jgi:hypothetical protein